MNFDDFVGAVELEGQRCVDTLDALDTADITAIVPTCPDWTVRDLALHLGEVHRWARFSLQHPGLKPGEVVGELPTDAELAHWLSQGASDLAQALRSADPDGAYFTFLADVTNARSFWARRQAHETAIHRLDMQSVLGAIGPFDIEFALDGIDEMLTGFLPRKHTKLRSATTQRMLVTPSDSDRQWLVTITEEPVVTARSGGDADCQIVGTASDLYAVLWNRPAAAGIMALGNDSAWRSFADSVQIRWA